MSLIIHHGPAAIPRVRGEPRPPPCLPQPICRLISASPSLEEMDTYLVAEGKCMVGL